MYKAKGYHWFAGLWVCRTSEYQGVCRQQGCRAGESRDDLQGYRHAEQVDLRIFCRSVGRYAEEAGLGSAAIAPRSPDILFWCQERGNK